MDMAGGVHGGPPDANASEDLFGSEDLLSIILRHVEDSDRALLCCAPRSSSSSGATRSRPAATTVALCRALRLRCVWQVRLRSRSRRQLCGNIFDVAFSTTFPHGSGGGN